MKAPDVKLHTNCLLCRYDGIREFVRYNLNGYQWFPSATNLLKQCESSHYAEKYLAINLKLYQTTRQQYCS